MFRLFIFFIFPSVSPFELPKGVPFSRSTFYHIAKPFTCLDGSASIPWHKVNDDSCDCSDGSDEPGTSACENGLFFCSDVQYKSVSLHSAFVNDGYCDCCDGSDEYNTTVTCESTCGVLAAAVREARSIKRNEVEQGHRIVKEYVEKLKTRREEERVKAEKLAEECAQLERLRDERRAQEDAQKKLDDQKQDVQAEDIQHATEEERTVPDTEVPAESKPVDDHISFDEKPIADYVEQIPASPFDEPHSDELPVDSPRDPRIVEDFLGDDYHHPVDSPVDNSLWNTCEQLKTPPISIDYGPEEAFYMLVDLPNCLNYSDRQYIYEFCAFKEILQRDKDHGSNRVSLGRWDGWAYTEDDVLRENKYGVMLFKRGLSCWNGPERSVKVYVHCGSVNEIIAVAEPSRCEYEMHLRTPAACYDNPELILKRMHPDDENLSS